MNRLTLEAASIMVDAALEEGRRLGLQPLCVAVLDAGGHLLALKRDERASLLRPQIANGKAASVLGMGFGGRELARRAAVLPAFFNALSDLSGGNMLPVPGGVLIRNQRAELLGAIGISGDTSDNDERCAIASVLAANLVPDTGES
ncbi:heme-binding protein [Pseudomonas resinovorans]|uniref:GlcG/HbpS family heme-binding protein n=1 Tax=Metapseudomonas resinovorans TaxID=53412 RepID=UPI00237F9381|nr:heme-binding protein [Pseudomonas resinovorans]MDE3736790.1 heme-binding protein [Pseudomonas resinovorans]